MQTHAIDTRSLLLALSNKLSTVEEEVRAIKKMIEALTSNLCICDKGLAYTPDVTKPVEIRMKNITTGSDRPKEQTERAENSQTDNLHGRQNTGYTRSLRPNLGHPVTTPQEWHIAHRGQQIPPHKKSPLGSLPPASLRKGDREWGNRRRKEAPQQAPDTEPPR